MDIKINSFKNSQYWPKNALNDFPIYLEYVLKDYLKQIVEDNFQPKSGRKLELITAYKNKALVYSDVPEFIKERYDLPSRDEGIDVIKFNDKLEIKEVFQCKDYKNYVNDHDLGTFYGMLHKYSCFKNAIAYCVGSKTTRFKKNTKNVINYDLEIESKNLLAENPYTDLIENPYLKIYDTCEYRNLKENPYTDLVENPYQNIKKDFSKIQQPALRNCQKEAIDRIQYAIDNKLDDIRIKIPCGCGKTRIIYYFSELNKYNILIVVPRISIADEILRYFNEVLQMCINTYWGGKPKNYNSNVTLAVYDSVQKYINNEKKEYDIMFVDEAHNIIGFDLYKKFDLEYKSNKAKSVLNVKTKLKVFLSATINIKNPNIDYEFEYDAAVKEQLICQYRLHLYPNEYINNTKVDENEFNIYKKYLHNQENKYEFFKYYNRCKKLLEIFEDRDYSNVIIYCANQNIAKFVYKYLKNHDVLSKIIISGDNDKEVNTNPKYRRKLLNDFRKNKFRALCAVDCISEGTDLPIANTAIFFNDKNSAIKIIQSVGRVLRLDNKHGKKVGHVILISENNNQQKDNKVVDHFMNILLEYNGKNKSEQSITFHNNHRTITINKTDIEKTKKIKESKETEETEDIIRDYPNYTYLLEICRDYYKDHKTKPKDGTMWKINGNSEENIGGFISKMEEKTYEHKIRRKLEEIFIDDIIYFNSVSSVDNEIEFYKQFYECYGFLPYEDTIEFPWKNISKSFRTIYQRDEEIRKYIIDDLTKNIKDCIYCNNKFYIYEKENKEVIITEKYEIKNIFRNFCLNFSFNPEHKIDENEILEIKNLIIVMINNRYDFLLRLEEDLKISMIRIINSILIITDNVNTEDVKKQYTQSCLNLKTICYKNDLIYDEILDIYSVSTYKPLRNNLNNYGNINNILSKTLITINESICNNNLNGSFYYKTKIQCFNCDLTIYLKKLSKLNKIPHNENEYKMLFYNKLFNTEFEKIFEPIYNNILNYNKENFKNIFYNECVLKTNIKNDLFNINKCNETDVYICVKKMNDILCLIINHLFDYLYESFEYTDLNLFMNYIIKNIFNKYFNDNLNNCLMDELYNLNKEYQNYNWKDLIKVILKKSLINRYREWKENNIQIWIQIYDLIKC